LRWLQPFWPRRVGAYGIFGGGGTTHLPTVSHIEAGVAARLARSHDVVFM
jgi:hypothetical protein